MSEYAGMAGQRDGSWINELDRTDMALMASLYLSVRLLACDVLYVVDKIVMCM